MQKVLIVNPGSTSTKIAIYEGQDAVFKLTVSHPAQELAAFAHVADQKDFRMSHILQALRENGYGETVFGGVIGIGGLLKNVDSGVYHISEAMLQDLAAGTYGEHAANLGALLAHEIGAAYHIPAYIGDPLTVDEMQPIARMSGHPLLPRYGRTHTLNQKRIAHTVSAELGKTYAESRLIIAHLGGGISTAAHAGGHIIDSTSSRAEGAFSMDRSGQLNCWELAKLCFSGKYDKKTVLKMLNGEGGVYAYLGTKDFRDVVARMDAGDPLAADVFHALVYQVAKEIASMAAVLEGRYDAIVLTGGIVYNEAFTKLLCDRIAFLGRIILKPGEEEMESLAFYLNSVLSGEMTPKTYQ